MVVLEEAPDVVGWEKVKDVIGGLEKVGDVIGWEKVRDCDWRLGGTWGV